MAMVQMNKVIDQLRRVVEADGGEEPDGMLLALFLKHRDQRAFEVLVQRHGRMVLGTCKRVLDHSHDAEDAFQATFLVLVRKAASLVGRQTIGDWLYGVAYHTALKARAAALTRRAREGKAAEMTSDKTVEDVWRGLRPLLDQELRRLPEKYREPVVLCDLEGKTRKQAADQLGCPEGTVSGRLSRARVMLADRLTRHGLMLSGGSLAAVMSQKAASAAVPATLAVSTARAATLVAAGQAAAAGVISANVVALTEGVVKAMLVTKLKIATVVAVTIGMVGTGAGALTWQAAAAGQPSGHGTKLARRDATGQARENQRPDDRRDKDERPKDGRPEARARDGERPARRDQGSRLLPPGIDRLDLSDPQKEKVAELEKGLQVKFDAARKALDEAIAQARENQDREKAEAAGAAFRQEVVKLQKEAEGQLNQILTDAQKATLHERQDRPDGSRQRNDLTKLLERLDLTAEQREKVEKLVKATAEQQEALHKKLQEGLEQAKENQDREKAQELFRGHRQETAKLDAELVEKVTQLLTDEQRQKFAQPQRRSGNAPPLTQVLPVPVQERLGLTPEQREKVAKLQKEIEDKLKGILDDEQNRKLDEIKKGGASERPRTRE